MNTAVHEPTPTCIGFIVDGNRRWAKRQGVSTAVGHAHGLRRAAEVVEWAAARSIPHLIFYAFSTENWNRSPKEVANLMDLFEHEMVARFTELSTRGVAVRFIGDRSRLRPSLRERMQALEAAHPAALRTTVTIALSYGGRAEILGAVNRALAEGRMSVSEDEFSGLLDTAGVPDPDLIVRTSGEQRLSNFLPWQAVYSELFFTETLWPDFTEAEFDHILHEYAGRHRRRGR